MRGRDTVVVLPALRTLLPAATLIAALAADPGPARAAPPGPAPAARSAAQDVPPTESIAAAPRPPVPPAVRPAGPASAPIPIVLRTNPAPITPPPALTASTRCPEIAGGSEALARLDPAARLEFIRGRLHHDARRARQWSWGFGGSYAILTVASLALAPNIKDVASRPDIYVGAGSALIGLGLITLGPLKVMRDSDALEYHLAHAGPDVDRCRLLAIAEAMLIRDAASERFGRGWFTHTGNALLGVAAALILGLGYKRWASGIINGIASIGVGELMILTQPIGLVRDLGRYRAGDLRAPLSRRQRRRMTWSLTPNLARHDIGLQLVARF
jgi:hypothetical protein